MDGLAQSEHLKTVVGTAFGLLAFFSSLSVVAARMLRFQSGAVSLWAANSLVLLFATVWRFSDGDTRLRAFLKAEAGDSYSERRRVQAAILVALALMLAAAAGWLWRSLANWPLNDRIAGALTAGFACYMLVRAISFHPIDAIIYHQFGFLNLNRIIDLGMLSLISLTAMLTLSGWHKKLTARGSTKN